MTFKKYILFSILLALSYLSFELIQISKPSNKVPGSSFQNVVIALDSEPKTLDPRFATDANGMRIIDLIFQSLVEWDSHNHLRSSVAKKWSCEKKKCLFYIKKNIYFSNGRRIKAEDILFSFSEYRSEKYPFFSAFNVIHSVSVDETENHFLLIVNLKRTSGKFLTADLPVLKILPKKEVLEAGTNFHKKLIGSGPFQLKERSLGYIILQSRKNFNPPSHIDSVTFKIIRDDYTRFQKTLNGEIDIAQSVIPLGKIKRFMKNQKSFYIVRSLGISVTYLLINLKDPCLKQKEIRKALTLSINVPHIVLHKLKGFAIPANSFINPDSFFFNKAIKPASYNPEKARLLAGGFCQKHILSLKSSNGQEVISQTQVLSRQLQKGTGISVYPESFEWGTFYEDINKGRFQLALLQWVGVIDPDIYRLAFHSKEWAPKGRNRGFYKNKTLDHLLDQGQSLMNQNKRKDIYDKVQMIIMRDMPIIPLWHQEQVSIVKKRIKGYHLKRQVDFRYLLKTLKLE